MSAIHTNVYGDAELRVRLGDQRGGSNLFDRVYAGRCETRKASAECDTASTKAEVVSTALEDALGKFAADVAEEVLRRESTKARATGS